jgi:hypothetical protein
MARPRKQQPSPESIVEEAVNHVGYALNGLQNVFEAEGHALSVAQHQKVFTFLITSLEALRQKTLLTLSTAVLTSGQFSLDQDLPPRPPAVTPHALAQNLHMPAAALAGAAQRGPRLFGEVKPGTVEQLDKDKSEDGIGFIDD